MAFCRSSLNFAIFCLVTFSSLEFTGSLFGALAVSTFEFGGTGGIFEVTGHCLLDRLAGVHEPENDKQRHHRRNKIGVGNLPGAAVMAAVAAFLLDDDDGLSCHRVGSSETGLSVGKIGKTKLPV